MCCCQRPCNYIAWKGAQAHWLIQWVAWTESPSGLEWSDGAGIQSELFYRPNVCCLHHVISLICNQCAVVQVVLWYRHFHFERILKLLSSKTIWNNRSNNVILMCSPSLFHREMFYMYWACLGLGLKDVLMHLKRRDVERIESLEVDLQHLKNNKIINKKTQSLSANVAEYCSYIWTHCLDTLSELSITVPCFSHLMT